MAADSLAASAEHSSPSEATPVRMAVIAGDGLLQAAVIYSDGRTRTVVDRTWQCEPAEACAKLEDAVYDEQVLFEEIPAILLLKPTVSVTVPAALTEGSPEAVKTILDRYDLSDNKDCFAEPLDDPDGNLLLYSMPGGMRGFLQRCFPTEKVSHRLLPFLSCRNSSSGRERGDRMWVDIQAGYADIAAWRDGHLLLANTRHLLDDSEAAYYTVFTWRTLGMDDEAGQLLLTASPELRARLLPELRKYVNYVAMPTLPARLREALTGNLPLCAAAALVNAPSEHTPQ